MRFVDWEPQFFPEADSSPDSEGMVWLYDAEGEPLVKCRADQADVVAAALEYAHGEIVNLFGLGWMNLDDNEVANLFEEACNA